MPIRSPIFQRAQANFSKLSAYGFHQQGSEWHYQQPILDGDFVVEIVVNAEGEASSRVIDSLTKEEYANVHITSHQGEFVNRVREAYEAVLQAVVDNAFEPLPFISEQANRLAQYIARQFAVRDEYLWSVYSNFGVFRHATSEKWFAIVMNVDKSKLTQAKQPQGKVEVVNLKVESAQLATLLKQNGFYLAYHMNKKSWISILLDGSVPDEQLFALLQASYQLVAGKRKSVRTTVTNSDEKMAWLIPANPKYYDVEQVFTEKNEITWKQSNHVAVGDTVYLYLTAPRAEIVFQCEVTAVGLPNETEHPQIKIKQRMRIKLVRKFERGVLPMSKLKSLGVSAVRSPRRAPEALNEYIAKL